MQKYSVFSLVKNALSNHENWDLAWKDPTPKKEYDVVIIGGGGHGLATAYYLAKEHNITNVAIIEKGWIGGGNVGNCVGVICVGGWAGTMVNRGYPIVRVVRRRRRVVFMMEPPRGPACAHVHDERAVGSGEEPVCAPRGTSGTDAASIGKAARVCTGAADLHCGGRAAVVRVVAENNIGRHKIG